MSATQTSTGPRVRRAQGQGTDALAGARARYFQGGVSNYFIDFDYR